MADHDALKKRYVQGETARPAAHSPGTVRQGTTPPGGGGGIVGAAVTGGRAPVHIDSFARSTRPAVKKCRKGGGVSGGDETARANIRQTVKKIRAARPILSKLAKEVIRGMEMNFTAWNPGKLNYYN